MSNSNWTPLWSDILRSSLWVVERPNLKEVKILWVTILALKDSDGIVRAAVPGLAKESGLTLEETLGALKVLEEPDPWSSCKKEGGRRLLRTGDSEWKVVSHDDQIARIAKMRKASRNRVYQMNFRNKKAKSQEKPEVEPEESKGGF